MKGQSHTWGSVIGWQFAGNSADHFRRIVEMSPEYGVTMVSRIHDGLPVQNLDETLARARDLGIDVCPWQHELALLPPPSLLRHGKPDLDNPGLWDWMADRYRAEFESHPDLGGIILTVTETAYSVLHDHQVVSSETKAERLARVIHTIWDVCREYDRKLWVRTFTWVAENLLHMLDALNQVPQGIGVMSKEAWGDWYQRYPHNPFIGAVHPHPQIMEFDFCGQYAGAGRLPWVSARYLQKRLRHARNSGCVGAIVRLDWGHGTIIDNINEIGLHYFTELIRDPDSDPDALVHAWCRERYGSEGGDGVAEALILTNDIIQKLYFVRGLYFMNTSSHVPPFWTSRAHSFSFEYSFLSQWDQTLRADIEDILRPSEETFVQVAHEKAEALSLWRRARATLDRVALDLKPEDRTRLDDGFTRLRLYAETFRALTRTQFRYRRWRITGVGADRARLEAEVAAVDAVANEVESTLGDSDSHIAPESIRSYTASVHTLLSPALRWVYETTHPVCTRPALFRENGEHRIVIIPAQSYVICLDKSGQEIWTLEIPYVKWSHNYSSPVIAELEGTRDQSVLFGATDSRLYTLRTDGTVRWTARAGHEIGASPVLWDLPDRQLILAGALDGVLYAWNPDGSVRWTRSLDYGVFAEVSTAVWQGDPVAIVATLLGGIYALDKDGQVIWERPPAQDAVKSLSSKNRFTGLSMLVRFPLSPHSIHGKPYVDERGVVVGDESGHLKALDMDGGDRWTLKLGSAVRSAVSLGEDDTLVVGTADGRLLTVSRDGKLLGEASLTAEPLHPPVPITVKGQQFYAIGTEGCVVHLLAENLKVLHTFPLTQPNVINFPEAGVPFGAPVVLDNHTPSPDLLVAAKDATLYCLRTDVPWTVEG